MRINHMGVNNRQESTFRLHREKGTNDYLFVLFKSPSQVRIEGAYRNTNFGDWIIFDKHSFQSYFPIGEEFVHDFIHFDFESEQERTLLHGLPLNQLTKAGQSQEITWILTTIAKEYYSAAPYKKEILNHLGQVFFLKLKTTIQEEPTPYYHALTELRAKIYSNPQSEWTVERMSKEIHISIPYIQAVYKKMFGISCINDVIKARITAAKQFLIHSDMPEAEIAAACGYKNIEHFIRQFKQYEGITPMQFKKKQL